MSKHRVAADLRAYLVPGRIRAAANTNRQFVKTLDPRAQNDVGRASDDSSGNVTSAGWSALYGASGRPPAGRRARRFAPRWLRCWHDPARRPQRSPVPSARRPRASAQSSMSMATVSGARRQPVRRNSRNTVGPLTDMLLPSLPSRLRTQIRGFRSCNLVNLHHKADEEP